MCWEYSEASCIMIVLACSRAASACIGARSGSKFDLCCHPAEQFESPIARRHGAELASWGKLSFPVIIAAMNSFKLSVNTSRSSFVNSYRQARPDFRSKPPMPCSDASETVTVVGRRNTTELIEIPRRARRRNLIHRKRSSRAPGVTIARPCRSATRSSLLMRFRKWRADGIMYPTWFRRPTSVFASSQEMDACDSVLMICRVHARALSSGRAMRKALDWNSSPGRSVSRAVVLRL